jgi:hypothetical protein
MSRRRTQQGAQTMTTKQNDTVALTDEQLDAVAGAALSIHSNIASMVPRETPIPKVFSQRGRAKII